jgi:hypothetical protein
MNEIDKLTLKLLTSKKRYNNYLANNDPEKSAEIDEYNQKLQKYVPRIKQLISKYFDDPNTQTSNIIDESLENCFKHMIRHFEMIDYEEKCAKNNYDETDSSDEDDTIFNTSNDHNDHNDKEEEEVIKPKPQSFWGKNINKTNTLDNFIKKK